jgi:hypothetical protein
MARARPLIVVGTMALGCEFLIGDPPRSGVPLDEDGGAGAGAASSGGETSRGGSGQSGSATDFGGAFPGAGTMPNNEAGGVRASGGSSANGGSTSGNAANAGSGANHSGGVQTQGGSTGSAGAPRPPNGGFGGGIREGGAPGVGGADAGTDGGSESGAGGAPACTSPVTWYRDEDGDGYGTDVSSFACPSPEGRWARRSRDCDDTREEVHPDQAKFFAVPYQKQDATDSFDYDCSGTEDPNPTLTLAPEDCGLLQLALCGGASGYVTNNRAGPGINAWCGSSVIRSCEPKLLVCEANERTAPSPFSCR